MSYLLDKTSSVVMPKLLNFKDKFRNFNNLIKYFTQQTCKDDQIDINASKYDWKLIGMNDKSTTY